MSGERAREGGRVLVTGGGGFIGAHLVAHQVAAGRRVVAVDVDVARLRSMQGLETVEVIEGDVAEGAVVARALEDVETVFHLAATHLSVSASLEEYRRVNVEAVRQLVARARESGVRRFVHCSTVGVYGELRSLPADEDSPCRPEFDYEVTKLEGERVVMEAIQSGFPATILRPAWVYGPGCGRTRKLFRSIAKGRFVVAGRGDRLRHGVYIRDMLAALAAAATRPEALGQVLIVADGEAVTVRTLVDEIASITGAPRPRSVPYSLLHAAAMVAELGFGAVGREPPLSRRTLRFFSGNTSFRTERARAVLGFQPAYTLRAGLRETHRILERGTFDAVPLPEPISLAGA